MALAQIPLEERPRERMLAQGIEALSLIELIAIVLGNGTKGKSVLFLAQEILMHFKSMRSLLEASIEELMQIKGIGKAKAIQLKAVFAIASKFSKPEKIVRTPIKAPEDLYFLIKDEFLPKQEGLMVILRDTKGAVFHRQIVSIGTLNEVLVHPREVFHTAIRHCAHSVIIAHNHPSGDPMPSKADLMFTRLLATSSQVVGIRFDDHLILGEGAYTSLWNQGFIKRESY